MFVQVSETHSDTVGYSLMDIPYSTDFGRDGVGFYLNRPYLHIAYCIVLWRSYEVWGQEIRKSCTAERPRWALCPPPLPRRRKDGSGNA